MQQKCLVLALAEIFPRRPATLIPATLLLLSSGLLFAAETLTLPELGQPQKTPNLPALLRPGPNGLNIASDDNDSRFALFTDISRSDGTSIGMRAATMLGERFVLGGGLQIGGRLGEFYANLGLRLAAAQRLMLSGGQLRQKLEFDFPSGQARTGMTQNSLGAAWHVDLGGGFLDHAEIGAYAAHTASRDLEDKTWNIDAATNYELWNDPRRIAGSRLAGLQGRLGLLPWEGGRITVGLGAESLRYDLQAGSETHRRPTASIGLEQTLNAETRLRLGVDGGAAQNRHTLGLDRRIGNLGILGAAVTHIQGRDDTHSDTRMQLSWSIPLGGNTGGAFAAARVASAPSAANRIDSLTETSGTPLSPTNRQWSRNLLDQAALRPQWMPMQVIAKRDTTAAPVRLIAIDKSALPTDTQIDPTSGAIATPIGAIVTGIAAVTLNGVAFANTGQFSLAGNSLIINTGKVTQPAPGALDTYVVTVLHADGSGSDVTIKVVRGSVKVIGIAVTPAITVDTIPNPFAFVDVTHQIQGMALESNAIAVAGINAAAPISITGGEYQINGGAWTSSAGTVTNGQTVKVRHTSAAGLLAVTHTTLTIGGIADTFSSTTADVLLDITPNAFSFTDLTGQALGALVESSAITVAGINTATAISIASGEYQINGGAWTSSAGTVTNGQTVKVRHTASASHSTATHTTLTIGGVSGAFTSTTIAADTTPDAFAFADLTHQSVSTLTESNAITVAGLNTAAAISVTGGEYQINGGAWTAVAGTVTNGQTVKVRHTTSTSHSTATHTTLTIGGVSDTFTSTTIAADTTPDAFDIPNMTNQALSTGVTTNAITVAGINSSTTATTTIGTLVKNGTDTGSSSATVGNGDTVAVKLTTSGSYSTAVNGTLTIGGVSDNFSVTTLNDPGPPPDTTPDTFSFTDITGQTVSTLVESAAITVAGINAAASISVSGGEYQINGGAWTSSTGTVTVGQTVKVRHTTSASNSTATNTTLTIGGVADTFTTTTVGTPPVMGDVPNVQCNESDTVGPGHCGVQLSSYVTTTEGDPITAYRIASGSLPSGMSLNTVTGVIGGIATPAGTYNITVQAQDKDGWSNTDSITITVQPLI